MKDWITQLISKKSYKTYKEALDNAEELIDRWCKDNKMTYQVRHNDTTGCSRLLEIKCGYITYRYKFIVNVCMVEIGEYEDGVDWFGEPYKRTITVPEYYAHLDRC